MRACLLSGGLFQSAPLSETAPVGDRLHLRVASSTAVWGRCLGPGFLSPPGTGFIYTSVRRGQALCPPGAGFDESAEVRQELPGVAGDRLRLNVRPSGTLPPGTGFGKLPCCLSCFAGRGQRPSAGDRLRRVGQGQGRRGQASGTRFDGRSDGDRLWG